MDWGLDTSALLRIITASPMPLAEKVISQVEAILKSGGDIHISNLVVSEAYFALQQHYRKTKTEAIEALVTLSRQPGFHFSDEAVASLSQPNAATMSPGMVDRMIVGEYAARGFRVLACEKDFRHLCGAEVVG